MIEPQNSHTDNETAGQSADNENTLTTCQCHPVYDNQNLRMIGNRGSATLENYHFLEKLSHFDR